MAYEEVEIHGSVQEYLASPPGKVLNIGSGSGQDARFFCREEF